jgi:hypothetical protein
MPSAGGPSLSRRVEVYFDGLTHEQNRAKRLAGVVGELAGLLGGLPIEDEKEGYAEFPTKKYS